MRLRDLAVWATLGLAALLGGCGPGSGRYTGTDVAVTGVGPSTTVLGGEATLFVMTVTNLGPYAANDVGIANLIGNQLALTSITCAAAEGASCPTPTSVTMTVPSLPVGASLTFQVNATVAQGANGVISNTMTVSFTDDNDRINNSVTATGTAASNNVSVTGSAPEGPVVGGASTQFTMVVSNSGPATATDVDLVTTLSTNLSAAGAIDCVPGGGAVAPVSMPDGTLRSASIPKDGLLTCNVPVTVTAGTNAIVFSTMTVTAAGDQRSNDNSATASVSAISSDLGVSQTAATEVGAGSSTVFTATVANPGPGAANDVTITWSHSEAPGLTFDAPTCTGVAGALCPATLGPTMTVASLAAGRSLVFKFNVNVAPSYRGAIVNTVSVASGDDQDPGNNTASTTTVAVDPRNGAYAAFAADGLQYSLSVNFDTGEYTMSGNGQSMLRNFTFDAGTGDYVVGGNVRFRVATDLLVGGNDFSAGVLPYVAARSFATTLASIAGSIDLGTRNVPGAGLPVTHAGTALISGNTLSVCQSDTSQVVPVRNCAAAARKDYLNLRASGNIFTGITSSGEVYSFSVAETGGAKILLSAGLAPDASQQLRVGLIDSTGGLTYGPPTFGPSTTGDWLTITLSNASNPPTYKASGSATSDSASLLVINPGGGGPFSMLTGTSVLYNASIFVTQASPLVMVVGSFIGAASGLLEIALP